MKYFNFLFLVYFFAGLLPFNTLFCQTDTMKLLNIINRTVDFKNAFIQYSTVKTKNNSAAKEYHQVWITKNNENIEKIRIQSKINNQSITIIANNKEKLFINNSTKRADLTLFKLMEDKASNEYYNQLLNKHLPSFINFTKKDNEYYKQAVQYYSNPTNALIQTINDTVINNIDCFAYKITDFDPNSGYFPDYTGETEGLNSEYFIDYYYFSKTDSFLLAQKTEYYYESTEYNHTIFEIIEKIDFDNKQNENNRIYAINTDTLRSYISTVTKFDGKYFISEFAPFSVKKIQISKYINADNQSSEDLKYDKFLLVFMDNFCEECWKNLIALKNQINTIRKNNTDLIVVFYDNINLLHKGFFIDNNIKTIVSEEFFNNFVAETMPLYTIIDNTGKIFAFSNIMNKEVLKRFLNY